MEQSFQHIKTFRYEVLKKCENPSCILYVLHGYGQLAKYFIRKFNQLPDHWLIVAPEGMHRFYIKGYSGRVGASWMTKEAREQDISDNIEYLNALDKKISKAYNTEKRFLLGFSQGGATAARWKELGNVHFENFILWACVFPPDIDPIPPVTRQASIGHYFLIGTEDEFYSPEQQQRLLDFYTQIGYSTIHYKGPHNIVNETLTKVCAQIERKQ